MIGNDVELTKGPLIRAVERSDFEQWAGLYAGYAAFYGVPQDAQMRAQVFEWLLDADHPCEGLVAVGADGALVGLTHFRPFHSPLRACVNCFLDDLFVDPAARGTHTAEALIEAVRDLADARGWATVRWITADDNYRARGVYDKLATRTMWVTYDNIA